MAEKPDKAASKVPQKQDEKPGPKTIDVPFDDIIDAILSAKPESVRNHLEGKRARRRKKSQST
jgi:hypothetical protein